MTDYIIDKSGSDTRALNTVTNAYEFTNTNSSTVLNSVRSTLDSAGGGSIFIKKGTYDLPAKMTLCDNLTIVGEERDKTILNNTSTTEQMLFRSGVKTTGFKLINITCKSPGNKPLLYMAGATRCVLKNNRFWYSSVPAGAEIMVWLNSVDGTEQNYYNHIVNNIFEGNNNGQDMLGGGRMNFSVISGNTFIGVFGGSGQGIGQSGCQYVTYSNNTFIDVGNFIGLESAAADVIPSMCNTIIGNTAYNCGKLKLSLEGSSNKSLFNTVVGNTMIYGNSGIEDGNGYGDIIANNTIIRTTRTGIRGTFHHCVIEGNAIIETNHENGNKTIAGNSYKIGGILLQNNTANLATPTGTVIRNNKLFRSATAYTYEPDATSKTGFNGGILIDSNYVNTVITDNVLYNLNTDIVRDHGTGTVNRTNDTF
jgi:hypothetical protein